MLWYIALFLLVAGGMFFNLWGRVPPIHENEIFDAVTETVRDPMLKPRLEKIGFEYACNSCHEHMSLPDVARKSLMAEHTQIQLDHGLNSRCRNCHNIDNIETLKDYEGTEVAFARSELLCRTCHGPMYRDWQNGAHGRPQGHWNEELGSSTKATCVQCHDPHSPKFKPLAPAPAPKEARSLQPESTHDEQHGNHE